jgi:molybdopterin converting factor small subunit
MAIRLQLPPALRSVMGGERWVSATGATIGEALHDLSTRHPPLGLHFFDEQDAIRRNLVFVHSGALIRAREAASYRLRDGDELILTNALAGG